MLYLECPGRTIDVHITTCLIFGSAWSMIQCLKIDLAHLLYIIVTAKNFFISEIQTVPIGYQQSSGVL